MYSIRMSLNERNDHLFGFIVTVQILYTTDYHTLSLLFFFKMPVFRNIFGLQL